MGLVGGRRKSYFLALMLYIILSWVDDGWKTERPREGGDRREMGEEINQLTEGIIGCFLLLQLRSFLPQRGSGKQNCNITTTNQQVQHKNYQGNGRFIYRPPVSSFRISFG